MAQLGEKLVCYNPKFNSLKVDEKVEEMTRKLEGFTIHNRNQINQDFKKESDFLNNIYFIKMKDVTINQKVNIQKDKWVEFWRIIDQLGDQTNRLKSIIESTYPTRENDMPILKYDEISEYIIHGFDANENMSVIEVFTDKWERYTKERGSKELYKEWLREEYYYHSNRLPFSLTSKFNIVADKCNTNLKRVKAYLTVFIPRFKINWVINNQRYQDDKFEEIDKSKLIVFGILSPV